MSNFISPSDASVAMGTVECSHGDGAPHGVDPRAVRFRVVRGCLVGHGVVDRFGVYMLLRVAVPRVVVRPLASLPTADRYKELFTIQTIEGTFYNADNTDAI